MQGLHADHTPDAIHARLSSAAEHSYLGDGVLGAMDGAVTTFAIVAGAIGARLPAGAALVLGLANVFADGFSMAVGNYLRTKADRAVVARARQIEEHHIATIPDGEREEIRQIFSRKGFGGEVLDEIVAVITRDRNRWVDTMLTEELGLRLDPPRPLRAAAVTLAAFLAAGIVPLSPFLFFVEARFAASALATALCFLLIGSIKGRVTRGSVASHAFETLLVGTVAASLAYLVGYLTRAWVGM